jgi:hypothetical protein
MAAESEFPDDVWDAAVKARGSVTDEYFRDHAALVIAQAILTERNRCAEMMAKDVVSGEKSETTDDLNAKNLDKRP